MIVITRRTTVSGLLAIALLPAACASPSPVLYTLDQVPGVTRPHGPHVVMLRDIGLAPYLDRQQIVRSSSNYRIDVEANNWWGESFGAMMIRVLTAESISAFLEPRLQRKRRDFPAAGRHGRNQHPTLRHGFGRQGSPHGSACCHLRQCRSRERFQKPAACRCSAEAGSHRTGRRDEHCGWATFRRRRSRAYLAAPIGSRQDQPAAACCESARQTISAASGVRRNRTSVASATAFASAAATGLNGLSLIDLAPAGPMRS